MPRVVFMVEDEEHDLIGDGVWLTGRFSGSLRDGAVRESFRGLSLEDALAWARARTDKVVLRYGDEPDVHFSAGAEQMARMPMWPPPHLAPLVRRRHPDDRWRDRTDADAPIVWLAAAEVVPPEADGLTISALRRRRSDWSAAIAECARTADADWDSQPLDEFIVDLTAARDAAGGAEEFGWFSYGTVALRVRMRVEASTASAACRAAIDRLQLPPGWRAEWTARPDQ